MEEECKECGCKRIIHTDKESYCEKCGLVLPSKLVGNYMEYDIQKDRYYKREPTSFRFYDDGIGTIKPVEGFKDAHGKKLTLSQRQLVYKIRRASKLNPKKGYTHMISYTRGYREIEKITSFLGTTQCTRDTAILLFKKAQKNGCIKGRVLETSAAACVWLAYRCDKLVPPTMRQIIQGMGSKTDEKSLVKSTRVLKRGLKMTYDILPTESYITHFANLLSLDVKIRNDAIDMYNRYVVCRRENMDEMVKICKKRLKHKKSTHIDTDSLHIPQPSSTAIAATVIYLTAFDTPSILTQEQVCDAANITEVTMRNLKHWITISEKIMTKKLQSNQNNKDSLTKGEEVKTA